MSQQSYSRRRPYPYDLYIGNTRVMLEPGSDGNLVAQKTKTLDATAPVDYTYSSADPFKERTFEWTKLYGGYGQTLEGEGPPRRIEHGEFVDTSINGTAIKGPKFETHVEVIPALDADVGPVRQFIVAQHNGTDHLFAVTDEGVWIRTAEATPTVPAVWTPSLTMGHGGTGIIAGYTPQSAIRFRSNDTTTNPLVPIYGGDFLYLASRDGNLWRYNGASGVNTWLKATDTPGTVQGPGIGVLAGEARWLESVGNELWVAGDYWVMKTEDDPFKRAGYSGVIWIGDLTARITFLRQIDNTLYVFKEDGIYTLSDTGEDQEILPTLRGANNPRNGKNATIWMDRMWIPFGDQVFTIDAAANVKPDGIEQILENQSDVKGRWAAGASHNTWFMYEIYYNPLTADSYLIKHGTWVEATAGGTVVPGLAQFADAHHGALYTWENKEVTAAAIIPARVGPYQIHPGGNDRLYVGFANGTVEWCVLPQTSPNPLADPFCEFTTRESLIYLPVHHLGYQADNKLYRGISVVGPKLSNSEWVEVQYKFDTVDPFAAWTTIDPENPRYTLPNDRKEFPNNTFGRSVKLRIKLLTEGTGSPAIDGIAVHQALRPALALEWTFSVKLASHLAKHNGTTDRRRGSQLRAEVQNACAYPGNIFVTLPTGEVENMTLIDYRESAGVWSKRRDHEWLAQVTGIQLRTLSRQEAGFAGLTYNTLETYTLGQLETMTIF